MRTVYAEYGLPSRTGKTFKMECIIWTHLLNVEKILRDIMIDRGTFTVLG
jgi:hypothetical protein